jgi:putative resolvase
MNDKNINTFITIREASKLTGLCAQTLRKLADEEKIKCYKTTSGQRRFDKHSLAEMCNTLTFIPTSKESGKNNFIYARVSSQKQLDDLSRQIEYIRTKKPEYESYTVISDVGSGINFNRKGLSTILDACLQRNIREIVIAHRDRMSRFGFDLINLIVQKSGGKITVIDDERNKSTEQELSEDLLSIIHIFSCRQMGKRKYKRTSINDEIVKNKT